MAKNGRKGNGEVSDETLRELVGLQRIGNRAVHKAQEENRSQGIPNRFSIGGKIVSDGEVSNEVSPKDTAGRSDAAQKD